MVENVPGIAVVGAGIRGTIFAQAVAQNPNAHLVAICDPSESARSRITQLGVPVFGSAATMLESAPGLTAAIVATPDFAHRDAAIACLERGLDIMLEKPIATSVSDAQSILDAAQPSGQRIMVGFENRWNPRFTALRESLNRDECGPVVSQIVNLNDTIFVPTRMLSWASKTTPAWFLMPHTLDLAIWLSGAKPTSVFASSREGLLRSMGVDTHDSVSATFEMDDDSYLVLNSSWCQPNTMPNVYDFRYEIQTTSEVFHVDAASQGVTRIGADGMHWLQESPFGREGRIRGMAVDMADDFVRMVRNEPDVEVPDEEDGLLVTRALEAVHRSLNERQVIRI